MQTWFLSIFSASPDSVNKPDDQRSTVRPQASFSLDARAFFSDVEAPPFHNSSQFF